jgi:hypothetical protein
MAQFLYSEIIPKYSFECDDLSPRKALRQIREGREFFAYEEPIIKIQAEADCHFARPQRAAP